MNLDAEVFGTVLQKLKSVLSPDGFASICQQIKEESILDTLCVQPWSSEQLSSILDMLHHIVPKSSRFNPAGKDNFIEFVANSQDIQWSWSNSNPKAMLYFSECGEVLAAVLQKIKYIFSQDEFASICQQFKEESILETICIQPWNSEQLSSILDMLHHIVPMRLRFNPDGKDNFIEFVAKSQDIQWSWSKSNPKAILYFSECGEVLAAVLQKIKSILSQDEFASFCQQFKEESILETLCVQPWNSEQFSSILDMLQDIVPTSLKFNLAGNDKFIDFVANSQDIQWSWSKFNQKAIHYFSESGEVLAVVLQKLKSLLSPDEFASICKEFLSNQIDNESIVQLLSVKPWNSNQICSIWDLLKLNEGKEKMIEYITDSLEDQWKWMRSNPNEILSFSDDGDIFTLVLKKAKQINAPMNKFFGVSKIYSNGNTILHQLSKDPLSDTQMDLVMTILEQKDFKPDVKNNDGKTFLELSPIHQKLLQRINTAPDDWAINTFFGFVANGNIFVSWINLGDDRLFEAILIRIRQILSLSSFKKPVSNLFKSKQSLQFLYLEQFFKNSFNFQT